MTRNLLILLLLTALFACNPKWVSTKTYSEKDHHKQGKAEREERSEAADAMDYWGLARTFPDGIFHSENLQTAFNQRQIQLAREDDPLFLPEWKSLGPANIAGRMLCLAFHPTDSLVMWAGSASGGLWKTTTAGVGSTAWQRVKTGFPVLGVSSIAVSPNGRTIYVGTGEVYGYRNANGSNNIRLQRGSYGIGILKSTDGGITWSKSMDWAENNLRGVQKIILNPSNPNTVFAATTEGVFRSYDAGKTWLLVNPTVMAVDIEFAPNDTNRLYCTFGCLYNLQNGIFRSTDGGTNWSKLTNGLPPNYTGKTLLHVVQTQPNTLYASVANAESQIGLFKSINGGDAWTKLNENDVAAWQGWYSHDVAVHPQNPNIVIHVGIDMYYSGDNGLIFNALSNSNNIPLGRETPSLTNYIHADIHAVYFSPHRSSQVFIVSDGGIYRTDNLQAEFLELNGGLQTTQFYPNFSNSQQDSAFAIGGMQDNWTAIYDGQSKWIRVIGGDGMSTAIHPQDDNIIFGSYQYLNVYRSNDRGVNFWGVTFGANRGTAGFNGPFEIAPSNPNVMYAGSEQILRSENAGQSFADGVMAVDSGKIINTIAINPLRDNALLFATFPTVGTTTRLFKTSNAGRNNTPASGLPNRVFTDIAYHPKDTNKVLVTLGGFGTQHVYRSTDGGTSFQPFGEGLPDMPTNTVVFDPFYPQFAYAGNDLGVYFSSDTGSTWRPLSTAGLPEACLVMHLSISPVNRKLRAATHGNGIYEIQLLTPQNLRQPIDAIFASANMETTNQPLRANYFLKNTRRGDTLSYALAAPNNTRLVMPSLPFTTTTSPDYPFPHPFSVPFNDSIFPFKLTPTRTIDPFKGVSTYDIALISREILGIDNTLTTPFKLIAADVNGDGSVDALDILLIRRFVLRMDLQFASVPQWVFIPKTYPMPASPPRLDSIPQSYYFSAYSLNNPSPFAFWAIKMGDVNNSYEATDGIRSPNGTAETRSEGLVLTTDNQYLEEENIYEVNLKASKSMICIGLQGTLTLKNGENTEGSSFLDFSSSTLKNFGEANSHATKNGRITFSWNDTKDQTFGANTPIFKLIFKAKKSGFISDFLELNSDITTATAFNERGKEQNLSLKFEKTSPDFTLDAQPNPFSEAVNVKIDANTEGACDYAVFDDMGKQIFKGQQNIKKGESVLRLNSAATGLTKSGIYFLKIETKQGAKTIKLVRI